MFDSFIPIIQENPILSGSLAAAGTILFFLIVSAIASGLRGERPATPAVRREPVLGRRLPARPGPALNRAGGDEDDHRRGFGFVALAFAFFLGAAAGVGGWAAAESGRLSSALQAVSRFVGAEPSNAREPSEVANSVAAASEATTSALPPPLPTASAGPRPDERSDEVGARLAAFVGTLERSLPRDAGPELVLTTVDATGMTVNLGYAVGRSVPREEVPEFDAYIMRTIRSLFCGQEAREVRFLNENGVAFNMAYTDPGGETVARLTVPPDFCA